MHRLTFHKIANLVLNHAKLDLAPQNLVRNAATELNQKMSTQYVPTPHLVKAAYAFASAARITTTHSMPHLKHIQDPHAFPKQAVLFLDRVAQRIADDPLTNMYPQDLATAAWALATTGRATSTTFSAIARELGRNSTLDQMTPQLFSRMAWSFAVLGGGPPAELNVDSEFTTRCLEVARSRRTTDDCLCQLHIWMLWLDEVKNENLQPEIPASLQKRCRDAFVENEGRLSPSQSKLHEEIRKCMRYLGFHCREEFVTPLGYSVDIEAKWPTEERKTTFDAVPHKLWIEIDGPTHYLGGGSSPDGGTSLKRRLLRQHTPLVSIPYWEWSSQAQKLYNGSKELRQRQCDYLIQKLSV